MQREKLWLFLAPADAPHCSLVIPSLSWIAERAGALLEAYTETARDGALFAATGSTVLGGGHHQQFNYLHAVYEVSYILYGEPAVFASSVRRFGGEILARAEEPVALYQALLGPDLSGYAIVVGPDGPVLTKAGELDPAPYLFPEIYFREALGLPLSAIGTTAKQARYAVGLPREATLPDDVARIAPLTGESTYATVTLEIARRWEHLARGVAFGDPAMIASQLATHCREKRVPLFAPISPKAPAEFVTAPYTESVSAVATEAAQLALRVGNRVIAGRQTGDGDIFEWSRHGVCVQIADPNRPVFPVIDQVKHAWSAESGTWLADEPTDAELRAWAAQGKVLSTLIWHSGEVAHNEAMLNLCDLAGFTGLKMGLGVHAQRYETAPQTWEMIQVARDRGGMRGLIEPVLHSGGLGVLAEAPFPPERLRENIAGALERITAIAGPAGRPRGYLAFLDTDLAALTSLTPGAYAAAAENGLSYFISSAMPGRNRILHRVGDLLVLNQSYRVVHGASPFVRITHAEDLGTYPGPGPGWTIGVLDAPVIAFGPYLWRKGGMFMEIVDRLTSPQNINVLPYTIARYARILAELGMLPG